MLSQGVISLNVHGTLDKDSGEKIRKYLEDYMMRREAALSLRLCAEWNREDVCLFMLSEH